jgi:hypothetical protein
MAENGRGDSVTLAVAADLIISAFFRSAGAEVIVAREGDNRASEPSHEYNHNQRRRKAAAGCRDGASRTGHVEEEGI